MEHQNYLIDDSTEYQTYIDEKISRTETDNNNNSGEVPVDLHFPFILISPERIDEASDEIHGSYRYFRDEPESKWKLVLTKPEIHNCVKDCANKINEKFKGQDVVMVCILKGAAYFFVDLTRELAIPHSCYFIEATSYHNSQTQSATLSVMSSIEPKKFEGKQVILVDELFDNGQTMYEIKQAIHEKANVPLDMIYTCVAFKKNKETKYPQPDLFGVEVPNVWLVGYGLDDKQEKRNWTSLFACPKSEGIPQTEDDKIFEDSDAYNKMRYNLMNFLDCY